MCVFVCVRVCIYIYIYIYIYVNMCVCRYTYIWGLTRKRRSVRPGSLQNLELNVIIPFGRTLVDFLSR